MSASFYLRFEKVDCPCYWLPAGGGLWMNEAAGKAPPPLGDAAAIERILQQASANGGGPRRSAADVVPLPEDALRLEGLLVLPMAEGVFALAAHYSGELVEVYSRQMREQLANLFALLPLMARRLEDASISLAEEMQESCYKMLRTVRNMENAARLARGDVRREGFDLKKAVASVTAGAQAVLGAQGTPIGVELPEDAVVVAGDVHLLEDALLNILRNALQYGRDGNRIAVRLTEKQGRALLTVEDRGLGILPENLPHIFEPYFSADPYGDAQAPPGLGLGLALVRETAQVMGGTVAVESRFGQGTTLTLSLPCAKGAALTVRSEPEDYLLNRYSPVYVQLIGLIRLPGLQGP